jgi:hypothetical protein
MTTIFARGLTDAVRFFNALPDIAEQAGAFAINDVLQREGMVEFRREMRNQVFFPPKYLEAGRLRVGKKAKPGMLEGSIKGRDRATSLARFAVGQNPANTRGRGVRVQVKRGQTVVMRKAFMVNLKNGNVGVAVRVKPNETLQNSSAAVRLADNVYLLYGPSVDQVFRGVADDVTPDLLEHLDRRFDHHFRRLTRG